MVDLDPNSRPVPTQFETIILPSTPISTLEAIERPFIIPKDKEEFTGLVEFPLRRACLILWDKGIRTIDSSANKKNVGDFAYINIDLDTLSEENKAIAKACATKLVTPGEEDIPLDKFAEKERVVLVDLQPRYGNPGQVRIGISINEQTTVADVERWTCEIANKFKRQPATWVEEKTLEGMKKLYNIDESLQVDPEEFVQMGYYYDEKSKKFFRSKELFQLKYGPPRIQFKIKIPKNIP